MAGRLIHVIPKTTFDFSGVEPGLQLATIPIGEPIDAAHFSRIGLAVRVHDVNITFGNVLQVNIYEDGFLGTSSAAFPGDYGFGVDLNYTTQAPIARFAYYTLLGQYATIGLRVSNGSFGPTILATLSVDAYLRNGDETRVERQGNRLVLRSPQYGRSGSAIWAGTYGASPAGGAGDTKGNAGVGGGGGGGGTTGNPDKQVKYPDVDIDRIKKGLPVDMSGFEREKKLFTPSWKIEGDTLVREEAPAPTANEKRLAAEAAKNRSDLNEKAQNALGGLKKPG